jgi:hypothetical protein
MQYLTLIVISAIIAGCGSNSRNIAPDLEFILTKKGRPVGGTVVYNPYGLSQLSKMRRNKAIKRMRSNCHPAPHKIIKEETLKPEERNKKYAGNMKAIMGPKIRFLDYECIYPY